MAAGKRHADEVLIDVSLVRLLVTTQFPQWADRPIKLFEFGGWDNRTFQLGEHMTVRLPSDVGPPTTRCSRRAESGRFCRKPRIGFGTRLSFAPWRQPSKLCLFEGI
jgi:hypothetical protein